MAGIDINTILNAIPEDKKVKGLQKLGQILIQKGRANYRPSESKLTSPLSTIKSGTLQTTKSTSTLSDVLQQANKAKLRNDFIFGNEYGLEFEDEEIKREEEESEASWQKKSDSDDSDDFQKPVDFGIDKETSFKLDKLN